MNSSKKHHNFVEQGNILIKNIPKKLDYISLQAKMKDKNQIKALWQEFDSKNKEIRQKYNLWFEEILNLIKDEVIINKLTESRNNLSVEKKLTDGVNILSEYRLIFESEENKDAKIKKLNKWKELISKGETDKVEFKSSFRWDLITNELNKKLELVVVKTIASILNSKGGVLFIGVDDNSNLLGIEKDYPTLKKQNSDGFVLYLLQVINNCLGKEFNNFLNMKVENIDGKEICVVEISKSDKPVFMKYDNKEEFYIRASLSSQPLNVREAMEYINMHWKR